VVRTVTESGASDWRTGAALPKPSVLRTLDRFVHANAASPASQIGRTPRRHARPGFMIHSDRCWRSVVAVDGS